MNINQLELKAKKIRLEVMKMLIKAGSGHPAGSLDIADIFAALYFKVLDHQPKKPNWENRDRVILSCGHVVPAWYATLALAGYFPLKKLAVLRQIDSPLQGHSRRNSVPGIENTSGPLGQGLSVACGVALAAKLKDKTFRTFCITSDGEQQEGQTWEAYLFASKNKLKNLTFILDRNNIQISGPTENIMPLEPLASKFRAFGLEVLEIDGHDLRAIITALDQSCDQPKMIIAKTIAGKGVKLMVGDFRWHGKVPKGEEAKIVMKQLTINN